MYLTAHINDELVIRPYTPVTSNDEIGYFDLVIKVWSKLLLNAYINPFMTTKYLF